MARRREEGGGSERGKGEGREGGGGFQNRVRVFCFCVPFFFFEWLLEQGGTCVYRLIKMSLDSEIFGFGYLVGLSRGMREAMRIGISCM